MKELTVKLVPTGWPQKTDDIEPGLFVMLDVIKVTEDRTDLVPNGVGVKSEYAPYDCYNLAGEFCSSDMAVPVRMAVESEEL